MVSSKYYVYGGGRWREVDAGTGRVSGWSGARLCVARRGRLVVQRGAARRRLLAALRALAAGRPSAARDGPQLSRKPLDKMSGRGRSRSRPRCRCCCHLNNNSCRGKSPDGQRSLTSDACIQTAPPPRRPRLYFPPSTVTTTATVHTRTATARDTSTPINKHKTTASPNKRRTSSTSWKHDGVSSSDSTEPLVNKTNTSPTKNTNLSLKRKRQQSDGDTSDTSKDEVSISQSILKKDFNAKYLRPRKSVRRASTLRARPFPDRPPRIRTRVIPSQVVHVSSDDENKDPTVSYASLKSTKDSETEREGMTHNKSIDLFTQKSQNHIENMETYRELVISEEEVEVLRKFMMRSDPRFDLYRYDTDDAYKAKFFYSINPLVSIERCPRILAMVEGRDGLSLQQFASQLGLRSVSDTASTGDRARRRRRPTSPYSHRDTSEDKENIEATAHRSLPRNNNKLNNKPKILQDGRLPVDGEKINKVSRMTEVTVNIERLREGDRRTPSEGSKHNKQESHSQSNHLKRKSNGSDEDIADERRKRPRKLGNHQESNTRGHEVHKVVHSGGDRLQSKEYSRLEDHAIVEWISVGERAGLVNGNRVWRSLEEVYEEVGGRARSWHSLRNRYLRHLLPALARLELPPALQARLRAAAARGEIKGKKGAPRRNSIYGEPARGASSRRPAPAPSPPPRRSPRKPAPARPAKEPDTDSSEARPRPRPRTPRYSEVTRQFAARRPPSSSSEFEPPKSPRSSVKSPRVKARSPRPRPRTRKLYNPNKL